MQPLDGAHQVRHVLGAIGEGEGLGGCVDQILLVGDERGGRMLQTDVALEAEAFRPVAESRDGDAVAEHVVHEAEIDRLWRDNQT